MLTQQSVKSMTSFLQRFPTCCFGPLKSPNPTLTVSSNQCQMCLSTMLPVRTFKVQQMSVFSDTSINIVWQCVETLNDAPFTLHYMMRHLAISFREKQRRMEQHLPLHLLVS